MGQTHSLDFRRVVGVLDHPRVRDHRTPWYARAVAAAVVAYASGPFDLIPDFVPVLRYLDDLLIVLPGIALVLKLVPAEGLADRRVRAHAAAVRPVGRGGNCMSR